MTAASPASEILSRWIDSARHRRLGGATMNLLWIMRDHVEEVRPIPAMLREKCTELVAEMSERASGKQIEEVKAIKEACGL